MAYTTNWGSAWTLDKNVFGVANGDLQATIYGYHDSVFAIKATQTNEAFEVRRWVNGTQSSVVDPATTNTTAGSRPGIVKVGNKLLVTTDIENATADSSEVKISDATWDASTTSWTHISQRTPIVGGGLRVPMDSTTNMKGAVMMIDMNAEDVYMADSSGISSAIEAALTSTDRQTPGFHRFWALPWGVRDSFLVFWQADATTNTALLARPGHLVYGGSGSATSIAWDTTAEITVLADGVLADNWFGAPSAVWFPGTDSGMFMFRQNNSTNVDLVGKLISRDGKTFGADTVLHAGSTGSQNKWGVNVTPRAFISGANKRFAVAYQDSLASGICNVRVLLVNYDTGTPAGAASANQVYLNDNRNPQRWGSKTEAAGVLNKK